MIEQLYKKKTHLARLTTALIIFVGVATTTHAAADKPDVVKQSTQTTTTTDAKSSAATQTFLGKDVILGQEDAPITLIEYASTTCGHCADFHNDTLPKIKEKYIDSGKAKLIFRHFPLNSLDLAASMISRCTTEERYYPLLGLYFKRQSTWMNATDPSAEVMKLARLAGIGKDTFDQCLANKDLQTYLLQVRQDGQKKYNVEATPTLIINGETHKGNMSFEALDEILSKLE